MSEKERKSIAGTITRGIYKDLNWEVDISTSLDEAMERVKIAHFLNGPTAAWIRETHAPYVWFPVTPDDFQGIKIVGNFAWLCFHHIQEPLSGPISSSFEKHFELEGIGNV